MKHSYKLAAGLIALASPAIAAEAGGGMPQLDPTWFPSQLFWLAVSFVVLYALVSFFFAPRVGSVLRARESAINEAIALAEKLKKEAANTKGNFEQISAEARAQASQLITEAQSEVAKEATIANEKLSAELDARMATAEAEIRKAVTKAASTVGEAATPLAKEMVEKLLGSKVDEASIRTAIDEAA